MPELVQAFLDDPKVDGGKTGLIQSGPIEGAKLQGECDVCGKHLTFRRHSHYEIMAVACSSCKPSWISTVDWDKHQPVSSKPIAPNCEKCGGPRKGRGYSHKPDCSLFIKKNNPSDVVCEKCGGPRRGRGFTHKPDCSVIKERKINNLSKNKGQNRRQMRIKQPRL